MGKYDGWRAFFADLEGDREEIPLDGLDDLIPGGLPDSGRRHKAWWSGERYYAVWREHGLFASLQPVSETVVFTRTRPERGRLAGSSMATALASPLSQPSVRSMGNRLLLLGCVKTKLSHAAPAKDLYISPLWEKRRGYAEASGQPWRILSAEHGLLHPDEVIEPYDRHLKSQSAAYQREWSARVARSVLAELESLGLGSVEIHASSAYVVGIEPILTAAGKTVVWPFEGLRQGEHLGWYRNDPRSNPPSSTEAAENPLDEWDWPHLIQAQQIGPFEFRWPDAVEPFEGGWEGTVEWKGRTQRFRHGIGGRVVYGRFRVHTVTWLDGSPTVEGVAADDYERSMALLSLIKSGDRSMVRRRDEVPPPYRRLHVVDHRSEIDAPYSRYGMAVKIRVDDLTGWVSHALLRGGAEPTPTRLLAGPVMPPDLEPEDRAEPVSTPEPRSIEEKLAVVQHLLEFAAQPAQLPAPDGIPGFTPIREANELLAADPFAFLIAVIADYQITAERAWSLPFLLKERLGHLDPVQLMTEPERLAEAVARRPSLHRYINLVPAFILEASRIVMERYDGDAGSIWANEPGAADLQRRLREFPGISQKKAAMAVEILERDLRVPVRELGGSDIAFDVHIRRVFLRTGLAEDDDADHMINIARRLHPERPGALDPPTWIVGRSWCHPANPDCRACVLDSVCAHRIEAGSGVRGA